MKHGETRGRTRPELGRAFRRLDATLDETRGEAVADDEEGDESLYEMLEFQYFQTARRDFLWLYDLVSPVLRPLSTIDMIVVQPYRKQTIDARQKFITMRCKLDPVGGGAPAEAPSKDKRVQVAPSTSSKAFGIASPTGSGAASVLDYKTFVKANNAFSFKKKLPDANSERAEIQRYLVANYDLRFRTHRMPRLVNRAWKARFVPATVKHKQPFVNHRKTFDRAAAFNAGLNEKTQRPSSGPPARGGGFLRARLGFASGSESDHHEADDPHPPFEAP